MDDERLGRMFDLIQTEFALSRAAMNEFRAEVNARFDGLRAEFDGKFDGLRSEMAERFESVTDRLDLLEHKVSKLTPVVEEMRAELSAVKLNVFKLDNRFDGLQMSVNGLAEDMRQRFRALNERLSSV
jgi:hypothetical protein